MVRVENLIVEGKCFIPAKIEPKLISGLKNALTQFMVMKGYEPESSETAFFPDGFLTMNFYILPHSKDIPFSLKIKNRLGIISEEKIQSEKYFGDLKAKRDDMPFKVNFSFIPEKLGDKSGIIINIRSEPVILYKMKQLGSRPLLDEFWHSSIIDNNKQFVNEIMAGLGAKIIEKPKATAEYITTPVVEKLEKLGFTENARLLKNGKLKTERGDIEDGLTDLRSSLELFIQKLVEKINKEPKKKLKDNLNLLKDEG